MNAVAPRSLKFSALFGQAAAQWPEELRLPLTPLQGGGQIVEGLLDIEERISAPTIGTHDEVLIRNLHWALTCAVQEAFRRAEVVRPRDLEAQTRVFFVRGLRDGRSTPELGWNDADRALADRYFEANAEAA